MSQNITPKRGLDLRLQGGLQPDSPHRKALSALYAVCPDDFPGFTPKVEVKEGDVVKCGTALLRDKTTPAMKLVSPVAGTVEQVVRGERRKILRVTLRPDAADADASVDFGKAPATADQAKELLLGSGLWAMMRQRPYDIVPNPEVAPRDIFVTGFDSAPLAADICDELTAADLQAGADLLNMLTTGNIYLSLRPGETRIAVPDGVKEVRVSGPHPAGNAGIQAANIAPVNKGQTIWTLSIDTLARIGRTARTGRSDWSVSVALVGSEVTTPCVVETRAGAAVAAIAADDVKVDGVHHRYISGNVLSGRAVGADGFLRWPYRQITVIREGDDRDEFMGWASVSPSKMSVSSSFPSRFMPWRRFAPDARLQGGRRAMIMSGIYEKMLPMDVMAEYLIKAIIARDIDRMEQLGIYEVAPEDFALAEYADPSKLELQQMVREGLDYMRRETE